MKKTALLLALVMFFFFNASVQAQNCDPWIVKIYNQLYGRKPSAAECNIKNYNNGSWGSYPELVGYIAGYNRYKAGDFIKGDPWIFQAYSELFNRAPIVWELNTQNYNNGSWGNYDELKKYIMDYHAALRNNGLAVKMGDLNGYPVAMFVDKNDTPVAADIVAKDGGKVIAAGGGNVIAAGGGNVIAAGGANAISISSNMRISNNLAGISFGADRTTLSTGTKVIATAGKTKLVIR